MASPRSNHSLALKVVAKARQLQLVVANQLQLIFQKLPKLASATVFFTCQINKNWPVIINIENYPPRSVKISHLRVCISRLQLSLKMDPAERPNCCQLLKHGFFVHNNFAEKFTQELRMKITREMAENPLLKTRRSRSDKDSSDDKSRRRERKEKKV